MTFKFIYEPMNLSKTFIIESQCLVHPLLGSVSRVQLGIPRFELGTFLERSYYSGHVPIMHR